MLARVTDDDRQQLLIEHLTNVANNSKNMLETIGMANTGYLLGILHDIGKITPEFQNKLINHIKDSSIDHKLHSSLYVYSKLNTSNKLLKIILSSIIAGHHSSYMDGAEVYCKIVKINQMDKTFINIADDFLSEHNINISQIINNSLQELDKQYNKHELYVLSKILYSILCFNDWLDAKKFTNKDCNFEDSLSFQQLNQLFDDYYQNLINNAEATELNQLRLNYFQEVNSKNNIEQVNNVFYLYGPTGIGKTLTYLKFALEHAIYNNMQKIIVVLPYTTLIEQIGEIYRNIFGEDNVLLHYSSYMPNNKNDEDDEDVYLKYYNDVVDYCNHKIVITTNVQFWNSLCSLSPKQNQKLNAYMNSVIIFDEWQTLPFEHLNDWVELIKALVKMGKSSIILATATHYPVWGNELKFSFKEYVNLLSDSNKYKINKVKHQYITEKIDFQYLCDDINNKYRDKNVMIVVNTKPIARNLYLYMKNNINYDVNIVHLSGNMYVKHRQQVLQKTITGMKNGEKYIIVTTQLIECGIDIDCDVVYSQLAPLSNLVQRYGRCNRNCKLEHGIVYTFEFVKDVAKIQYPLGNYRNLSESSIFNIEKVENINEIDVELYYTINQHIILDSVVDKMIQWHIKSIEDLPCYSCILEKLEIIENEMQVTAIVPHPDIKHIIDKLYNEQKLTKKDIRMLTQYSCNLFLKNIDESIWDIVQDKIIYKGMYDEEIGITNIPNIESLIV